jgi:ParB/RepB/Spo0J family partition protein
MARALTIPYKELRGFKVSPKDLIIDEEKNGRAFPYEKEDLEDLLQDFRNGLGIKQAITAKPYDTGNGNSLEVVAGYRRARAAQIYLKDDPEFLVPCILEKPEDDLQTLILNIRENVVRKDLSPIDLGRNAERLVGMGKSAEEAGEILGCSDAQVTQHIKLVTELDENTQILIHKRKITADDAFNLLKVSPENRGGVVETIQEELAEEESSPPSKKPKGARSAKIRCAAREAGGKIPLKLSEFKKYLQEAIDEEGPGSNKGEVELKKGILKFLAGELSQRTLDNKFNDFCKVRGASA